MFMPTLAEGSPAVSARLDSQGTPRMARSPHGPRQADRSATSASRYSAQNSSATTLPAVEGSLFGPASGLDPDLPFLDPRRRREVQTREQFVD